RLPRVCIAIPASEIETADEPSGSDERILRRRSASKGETTRDGEALEPELKGCGDCGFSAPSDDTFGSIVRVAPAPGGIDLVGAAAPGVFAWVRNSSSGNSRCACTIFNMPSSR